LDDVASSGLAVAVVTLKAMQHEQTGCGKKRIGVCIASSDSFWVIMQLEFACACRLTHKKVSQLHTSGVLAVHVFSSVALLLAWAIKSIQ
jgi:hypothetical protein